MKGIIEFFHSSAAVVPSEGATFGKFEIDRQKNLQKSRLSLGSKAR